MQRKLKFNQIWDTESGNRWRVTGFKDDGDVGLICVHAVTEDVTVGSLLSVRPGIMQARWWPWVPPTFDCPECGQIERRAGEYICRGCRLHRDG